MLNQKDASPIYKLFLKQERDQVTHKRVICHIQHILGSIPGKLQRSYIIIRGQLSVNVACQYTAVLGLSAEHTAYDVWP